MGQLEDTARRGDALQWWNALSNEDRLFVMDRCRLAGIGHKPSIILHAPCVRKCGGTRLIYESEYEKLFIRKGQRGPFCSMQCERDDRVATELSKQKRPRKDKAA